MRQALAEIAEVVRAAPLLTSREQRGLLDLIEELGRGDLLGACLLNPARWDLNRRRRSESRMQQMRASDLM